MKKILSILLVLAMLVTGVAAAMPEQEDGLPAVGDTVEGFVLCEEREFPLVGGTAYVFEHEQTGARFVYIANRDTNRVFDLTFFTRAIDNTGLPHVFEHATLNGSEKYPSSALFFDLSFQTYNTFMNAMTYPLMTTYPVASLSEEQLLRYADFYTDSCLHPSILEDESIFREEAWRYRMASLEDELSLEGTVYSEMLGAMDLDSVALYNMLRAAFPGSTIGNVSGGDPASIPDMTWEALRSYHDTYYHPSNCVAFLYGDIEDYTAFLKLLDEAFAPYDKREFSFEDPDYSPLTAPVEQSLAFPVEAGSAAENRSTVYYAFVCPGLRGDTQEELVLNTLTDLLIAEASPLIQQLKKALPYGSFGSFIEDEGPEDAILFSAENVNPEDAELFRETVDAVLAEVAEKGFAQDLVDGVMSSLSLSTKLTSESSEVGVQLIPTIAYSYASSGELFNYFDYVDALDSLDDWNRQGVYARAVENWLLGSETTALITTYPEPGLREQLDAAEAERLAAVKASMSEEELQAIVDATNAEKEEKDASAYVAQLQAVTVESLPEEQREYAVKDETGEDGIRRLSAEAGVDGIGQTLLLLDAAGIPQEDLHWFALYTALIGELDTSAHSVEELAALMTRYLYSGSIRLSVMDRYGSDEYHPYLRAGWIAADEDLAAGYDLLYELLYDTRFTDTETLLAHNLADIVGSAAMFLAMIVLMFVFDWRMGAACLLCAVISVLAMFTMMGGKNAKLMAEYQAAQDVMSKAGTEYVRGIPVVKVFQQTVYSFRAFKEAIEDYSSKAERYTVGVCQVPQSVNLTFTEGAFIFLVPVALLRRPVVSMAFGPEVFARGDELSFTRQGWQKFVPAILLLTAVFLVLYIWVDSAGTRPFWPCALRFACSLAASTAVSLLVAYVMLDNSGERWK